MANKFTNEEIQEIVSKLKWKPNKLSYSLIIMLILCIITLLILVIYLIVFTNNINCQFKNLKIYLKDIDNKILSNEKKTSDFENKNNLLNHNILKNSNEIRYLTSLSGRYTNNSNLFEKTGLDTPIFANQIEDLNLYTALSGN
jgi:short subunit fatty acids transporter